MYSLTFTKPELVAELTAKMLFEIEAVHFMSDKPFIFTSGKAIFWSDLQTHVVMQSAVTVAVRSCEISKLT